MSLAEALGEGLQVTVIGLIIVFSVLIILMLVMMLMKVIFYKPQNDAKTAQKPNAPAPAPVPTAAPAPAPAVKSSMDEGELVAVLTAAVAASLNTSTYHLNIKSYRRVENTSPAWNKAGLRDVIDARF